jgi:hypothetical protein
MLWNMICGKLSHGVPLYPRAVWAMLRCWETYKCWLTLNIGSSWGIKISSQIPRHLITLQNNTWCIVIRRLTSCMPKRASCFPTRSTPYLVLPFDRQYRIAIHRKSVQAISAQMQPNCTCSDSWYFSCC